MDGPMDATAQSRRAAKARAVAFAEGASAIDDWSDDDDDESLPSLSDEEVDTEELKRIARDEARMVYVLQVNRRCFVISGTLLTSVCLRVFPRRADPQELAEHAQQAAERVDSFERERTAREADAVPLQERLEGEAALGRSRWDENTADSKFTRNPPFACDFWAHS